MITRIDQDIAAAAALLQQGQLVAIPTETVYGLAANALDASAVARIYEVKNRPRFNPLILHCADAQQAFSHVAEVPTAARELAARFWPGPLTLVLPKTDAVPDLVTAGSAYVAVRVPAHPLTLELLRQTGFPLAAPSANPSNYVSPTTAQHVMDQLGGKIPMILEGGPANVGVESTIVSFANGYPEILRQGGLAQEAIEEVIGALPTVSAKGVGAAEESNGHEPGQHKPLAPGQLKLHYSPTRPFILDPEPGLISRYPPGQLAALVFGPWHEAVPRELQRNLSPSGDLNEAARHVFAALRELDQLPVQAIIGYSLPEVGLGRAVNDRLRRAAAKGA